MGTLIIAGVLIVLFMGLCIYMGIDMRAGFLVIIGLPMLIIIAILLVVHYGGRSAQTMDSSPPRYINFGSGGVSESYVPKYPDYPTDKDGSIIIPGPPGQEDKGLKIEGRYRQ